MNDPIFTTVWALGIPHSTGLTAVGWTYQSNTYVYVIAMYVAEYVMIKAAILGCRC